MEMKADILAGPSKTICWTPTRELGSPYVVLATEESVRRLEKFFEKPIHQQINVVKSTIQTYMRENKTVLYPRGIFLGTALDALHIAETMTFSYFASHLELREVTHES